MTQKVKWFLSFRFFTTVAMQMKMTILGYFLYDLSGAALSLGMLGLFEAIPKIGMAIPAGFIVERMEKRKALSIVVIGYLVLSLALFTALIFWREERNGIVSLVYCVVFIMGLIGSMGASASTSLFSSLIAKEDLPKFLAVSSNAWQIGSVIGPILAGLLISKIGPVPSFGAVIIFLIISVFSIFQLPRHFSTNVSPINWKTSMTEMREGLDFVFQNKTLLWAISLDLFAVLFGGCVALLPVFAKDILMVDSQGFGWLRAATPLGAALAMLILARRPIRKNTGKWLILFVGLFGVATICFALSENFILSLLLLFCMGAFDAVSVVIRGALLLLETPDHMRARVSSVNSMFISSSNEIGAFESGFAAQYMGTVRSVIFGGSMTLLFVLTAFWKADRLKNFEFKNK